MKTPLALAACLLLLAGCSAAPASGPATSGTTATGAAASSPGASAKNLNVYAAASLKGAFTDLKTQFIADHPGVSITYNFNGSSTLVTQLQGGAPSDVFASADQANMTKATDAHLISGTPVLFATNVLTLVVAPGNPAKITGLDASLTGKKLVVCAVGVPCGTATQTLAKNLGTTLTPVSQEQSVTDVLGKVTSGEADAGVVYATDAKSAGNKIAAVAIPGADKVVNNYPIGVTANSADPADARAFVDYVTGTQGQAVLAKYGFGKP